MNIFIYLHNWDHSLNNHGNFFNKAIFYWSFWFTAKLSKRYRDFPYIPCATHAVAKNLPANAGDMGDVGSIPGLGRSPGGGDGNPLQYPCLKNFLDRRSWQGAAHGVAESWTRLSAQAKPPSLLTPPLEWYPCYTWWICFDTSHSFSLLWFTVGVVRSVGLDKRVMPCIHHCSIILGVSVCPKNAPCSTSSSLILLPHPGYHYLLTVSIVVPFPEYHTVYELFRLASSTL